VKVVDDYSWPLVDLRIDWSEDDPIGELAALWQAYEPQMQAYITRARPAGGPQLRSTGR
jgi:uncharacterized Ntn-hydrolase superfamily protein